MFIMKADMEVVLEDTEDKVVLEDTFKFMKFKFNTKKEDMVEMVNIENW